MENNQSNQYVNNYFTRLTNYGGKGVLFGTILSLVLFKKWKLGAIAGLASGAGYCHKDLVNIFRQVFGYKNNIILPEEVVTKEKEEVINKE